MVRTLKTDTTMPVWRFFYLESDPDSDFWTFKQSVLKKKGSMKTEENNYQTWGIFPNSDQIQIFNISIFN